MYFNKICKKQKKRKNKARSQIKGSHKRKDWEILKKQCGYKCLMCGRTDVFLTKDHIIPVSKGGTNNIDNIQPVCYPCNKLKDSLIINLREAEDLMIQWFRWLAGL